MDPLLITYVALTAVLVATPGASTALVVRHALAGGRSAGLAAASGIAAANAVWALAAGVGLTAIFARVPGAFAMLQWGGAAYLGYLAIRSLSRAVGGQGASLSGSPSAARDDPAAINPRAILASSPAAFREGVAVNLLNPPVATFYMVVVPSFLPASAAAGRFALLAVIHVTMAFACHTIWVSAFDRLRALWERPAVRRGFEAIVGAALLALAGRMLQ